MARGALVTDRPHEATSDFATAKLRALGWALAAVTTLCLLMMLGSLVATHRESIAIATEREQRQVENALVTALGDVRSGLTSVTFWDEAAARTGVRFDAAWTDENIGVWLAQYYAVDQSFVVTDTDRVLAAYRGAARGRASDFTRYRAFTAPLIAEVRARLRHYQPGRPGPAFGVAKDDAGHERLDAARLVMVDGVPRILVVAPILPDFGHIGGPLTHPAILVACFRLDGKFIRTIGRDLMIGGLRVTDRSAPLGEGQNRLALTVEGSPRPLDLRWALQSGGGDLLRRSLPMVAVLFVVMLLASLAGSRFVRESAQQLYHSRIEATRDELTGLFNRRHLTRSVEQLAEHGAEFALLFIDLDRFKDVNDLWGHAAGDELIREAARRLVAIAGGGRVARFGGDEFVVVVAGGRSAAEEIGAEVLAALRRPFTIGVNTIVLAGSVGVGLFPAHAGEAADLMRKADLALYRAKALGKDRVVLFDEQMDGALRQRQSLERDLRQALVNREFEVDFQPQWGRGEGRLVGVEALARWRRRNGQSVEPSVFVPLAEDLGLIAAVDALILEEACRHAAAWPGVMLAVNVSPGQLHSPGYADQVLATLARCGLPPTRLWLEITETALVGHLGQVAQTVGTLRAEGVQFAIDDFGTGFSSLDRLRMLQLDGMKIDRSFVADLGDDPQGPALISSMVALGHALGLTVTAEGVETDAQFTLLQLAGCDEFQGNLLSAPVGAEAVRPLLSRRCRPQPLRA